MRPEDIQRLRELEAKGAAKPWTIESEVFPEITSAQDPDGTRMRLYDEGGHNYNDAQLIAEARNALPDLLNDWERMREHLTNLIDNFWPACPSNHDYDEKFTCAFCGCRLYGSSQGHGDGCEWDAAVQYAEEAGLL